jgi:hypothetical protein
MLSRFWKSAEQIRRAILAGIIGLALITIAAVRLPSYGLAG